MQDFITKLLPETPKQWAATIILYGMLIALIVIAEYVYELYDTVIELLEIMAR